MKRTAMKRGKPPQRKKRLEARTEIARSTKPIRKTSAKMKAALPALAAARREVRARAGGWCELRTPVCIQVGVTAHHKSGRDGDRLADAGLMAWTCDPCHAYAHGHPTLSYERGWMLRRTVKRSA